MSPRTAIRRPPFAWLGLAEERDRGAHRGRVGVVALVDQRRAAAAATSRRWRAPRPFGAAIARERARPGEIAAHERHRGKHREAVLDEMAAGRAELVGDLLAEDARRKRRSIPASA